MGGGGEDNPRKNLYYCYQELLIYQIDDKKYECDGCKRIEVELTYRALQVTCHRLGA